MRLQDSVVEGTLRAFSWRNVGTSLLTTEMTQAPRLSGHVGFDNYGNKFFGPLRLNARLNLNDLTGYGDASRILPGYASAVSPIKFRLVLQD